MKRRAMGNGIGTLGQVLSALPVTAEALSPVFVYEDTQTRNWARGVHERVESWASRAVPATWWKLSDLSQPGVLAGAVSKAMRSALVVIALRGQQGLPLPFYVWTNLWVPHREPGPGALVTLLGAPEERTFQTDCVREHLRAVARQGRMKLILQEMPAELMPESQALITVEFDGPAGLRAAAPRQYRLKTRWGGRSGRRIGMGGATGEWSAPARGGLGR